MFKFFILKGETKKDLMMSVMKLVAKIFKGLVILFLILRHFVIAPKLGVDSKPPSQY